MVAGKMRLRGLSLTNRQEGPVILKRTDQDFIAAMLDTLASENGLEKLAETRMHEPDNGDALRLYQPVHRTFHLAILELCCGDYGLPRVDPRKISSAGLVVRRLVVDEAAPWTQQAEGLLREALGQADTAAEEVSLSDGATINAKTLYGSSKHAMANAKAARKVLLGRRNDRLEGWLQAGRTFQGWVELRADQADLDTDPAQRTPALRSGNHLIDQMIAARAGVLPGEVTAPLFVAPPEVCAAAGKTILYGLVPVTSPQISEVPASLPVLADADITTHLSAYLREGAASSLPHAGMDLNISYAREDSLPMQRFMLLLRQLAIELDAFTPDSPGLPVYQALNQIDVEYTEEWYDASVDHERVYVSYKSAGDFLKEAAAVLIGQGPNEDRITSFRMPDIWPGVTAAQAKAIRSAAAGVLAVQLAKVASHEGRFDNATCEYRLRAFVRVKTCPGCPDELVWSDYSAPFTIVPWHEPGEAPPVQVTMPDVTDRAYLSRLKANPNVSFVVPASLMALFNNNKPEDLLAGKGTFNASAGLDWICSFNIPIITICAYIALNIILSLLDFFLHWMMFVKICVPFPRINRSS
jgi:hypothetical protein